MVQIKAQESFDDEIVVDNFAGGGGTSTGIELALGRIVNIAINHDPAAILLHKTNHPYTEHLQASVWDVDPAEVCRGRKVGLAWFSQTASILARPRALRWWIGRFGDLHGLHCVGLGPSAHG